MSTGAAPTQFQGGGDGSLKGVVGAVRIDLAQPYYQAYSDDQAFFQPIAQRGQLIQVSRAHLESYYQYLPPLSRGQLVPDGYPTQYAGLYLQDNFFPRIVSVDYTQAPTQGLQWSYPHVAGTAWSEALAKAYPGLKDSPSMGKSTVKALLARHDTVVVQHDSKGKACGWFSQYYGIYFSYAPHKLFDQLLRADKIFADPTSVYYQANYQAWLEPSWRESLRNFAEAVVVALAIAYVAAWAGADGSAGAGAEGGTAPAAVTDTTGVSDASIGTTNVATAVPDATTLAPIDTTVSGAADLGTTLTPIATTGESALAGLASTVGGAVATDAVKAAAAIGAADIIANAKGATPTPAVTATPGAASDAGKSLSSTTVLVLGALGLIAAFAT